MTTLKTSILAAIASAAITFVWLVHRDDLRTAEAARLTAANRDLELEISGARSERVRQPAKHAFATSSSYGGKSGPDARADYPGDYRNEGSATPVAAIQTFAWACDRGDVAAVGRLIAFDKKARAQAEAYLTSLHGAAPWKTPEQLAAALMTSANMHSPFPDSQILDTATVQPDGDDRVKLRLPNTPRDGAELEKTSDGWKYLITDAMAARFMRQHAPTGE